MEANNVAAVDIGTNSVRLLVVDGAGQELAREMAITRLGHHVDERRRLDPAAIERTLLVLADYKARLDALSVGRLRVTATSAVRDAENREEFARRVIAILGQRPEVLSGVEEAQLSFSGATASLRTLPAPLLVFDIGGGSTEFVLGDTNAEHLISLDIGCVRLTERYELDDHPTPARLTAAHEAVRELLNAAAGAVPFSQARTWIGVAGTVTTFGALDAGISQWNPRVTHGRELSSARVEALYAELSGLSPQALKLRLLEPRRAEVIVGGAVILVEIFRHFHVEAITISERDILDGLTTSLLS